MTHKLKLAKYKLHRWNRVEMGDIFRCLEDIEVMILDFQLQEERDGRLPKVDLVGLRRSLSLHHSLL